MSDGLITSEISIVYTDRGSAPSLIDGDDNLPANKPLKKPGWHFAAGKEGELLTLAKEPRKGLELYLEAYQFEGIGKETAKSIAQNGCLKVFASLNDKNINLSEELGVSKKVATSLRTGWSVDADERNLRIFLLELGFANGVINSISDNFGSDVLRILKKRPFDLVGEIPRLNFADIQEILPALQLSVAEVDKIIAGIHFCLARIESQRGHTAAPIWRVKKDLAEQFEFSSKSFDAAVKEAGSDLVLHKTKGEEFIQTKVAEARDTEIVERLRTIHARADENEIPDGGDTDFETPDKITLSEEQEDALRIAALSPVSIITGGPGTGKTSIVIALLSHFASQGRSIRVCAPTGRAAKRLALTDEPRHGCAESFQFCLH